MKLKRIGLDTSKAVFTLHGVDQDETVVLRRNSRRTELEAFFTKLPPTVVALEACGGSHHWGRRLAALGHTVRLIPPQYVKPFVRRGKNDRNDAEAICEAASRPGMPSVRMKAGEQQAAAIVLSARELLVRQRTQLVNAVRGHAAGFGIVAAKNIGHLPALPEAIVAEAAVPDAAKEMLAFLGTQVAQLDGQIADLERRMKQQHKTNPMSQLRCFTGHPSCVCFLGKPRIWATENRSNGGRNPKPGRQRAAPMILRTGFVSRTAGWRQQTGARRRP